MDSAKKSGHPLLMEKAGMCHVAMVPLVYILKCHLSLHNVHCFFLAIESYRIGKICNLGIPHSSKLSDWLGHGECRGLGGELRSSDLRCSIKSSTSCFQYVTKKHAPNVSPESNKTNGNGSIQRLTS